MRKDTMHVYRFTLKQMVKNKSNRAVFFILIAVAALAIPVTGVFFGGGGDAVSTAVTVTTVEEYLTADQVSFDTRYGVQYVYSIIALIICVFSVTYIVRSIVEELSLIHIFKALSEALETGNYSLVSPALNILVEIVEPFSSSAQEVKEAILPLSDRLEQNQYAQAAAMIGSLPQGAAPCLSCQPLDNRSALCQNKSI